MTPGVIGIQHDCQTAQEFIVVPHHDELGSGASDLLEQLSGRRPDVLGADGRQEPDSRAPRLVTSAQVLTISDSTAEVGSEWLTTLTSPGSSRNVVAEERGNGDPVRLSARLECMAPIPFGHAGCLRRGGVIQEPYPNKGMGVSWRRADQVQGDICRNHCRARRLRDRFER